MNTYLLILFTGNRGDALLLGPVQPRVQTWLDVNFAKLNTLLQFGGLPMGYVVNPVTQDHDRVPCVTIETWLRRGLEVAQELSEVAPVSTDSADVEARARRLLEHETLQAELRRIVEQLRAALEDYLLLEKTS